MTDPKPDEGAAPSMFAVLPTAEWALELERRLLALENGPVGELPPAGEPFDVAGYLARLERHRAELEALKTWCNELAKYLDFALNVGQSAPRVADVEGSPL